MPAWESHFGTAFHINDEKGSAKTVFQYQIPFSAEKEAELLTHFKVAPAERLAFYQKLLACIQHNLAVTNYLQRANVPSILHFTDVQQVKEDGRTILYLETDEVWPITARILHGEISQITLLDLLYRLSIILRDIHSETVGISHRGLDLNEVYIDGQGKILLGGFYYAACTRADIDEIGASPEYLPMKPVNLPIALEKGAKGSQGTDILTLAMNAWNLYSGNPFDVKLTSKRMVYPEYATDEIVAALALGLTGQDANCNQFRRRLTECRKALNKTEFGSSFIPVRTQRIKQFRIEYVDP